MTAPTLPDAMRTVIEARPGQWVSTDPARSVFEVADDTEFPTVVVVEPTGGGSGAVVNVFSVRRLVDERISPFLGPEVACERLRYALGVA